MSKNPLPPCQRKTTIGGQAIIEGIVMKGPNRSCLTLRKPDGELVFEEKETTPVEKRHPFWRLPVARGAYNLFTALKEGMEAIDISAKYIDEEEEEPSKFELWLEKKLGSEKLEKLVMAFAMVVGCAIPIALFFFLPSLLTGWLPENTPYILRSLLEGVVRIAIFLCFMWSVSHMKDIERTFRYHGAEHKTIFCYEAARELTVENVRKMPRFHPRCGTSFLFVVMIISILVSALIPLTKPLPRMIAHLILLPLIVGLSYEANRFAGRHDNLLCRILRWPGLQLQKLTVFEPDDGMIEVAIEAMKRVIPDDGSDKW